MIASLREKYNSEFSEEKYRAFIRQIHQDFPNQLEFRVAETPVFVPREFKHKLMEAGEHIIDVLVSPDFKEKTKNSILPHQNVPNEDEHTLLLSLDFGVCSDESGELTPQLIEMQGFASIYAYQAYLCELYPRFFYHPTGFSSFFSGLNGESYLRELRQILIGDCDPAQVILMDIYPEQQKTRIDFAVTKKLLGIEPVCYTKIKKRGKKLFYAKEGKEIEIRRIYNRLIFDELDSYPGLQTEFKMTDEVDIEWIGHPNWFFRISKFTLPFIQSPYVPATSFLSEVQNLPDDLENYVLKPLFSFAGTGVKLHPTKEELEQIQDRQNFILQKRVHYEPVIQSPTGGVKCEIRLLYLWHKNTPRPKLATNLARLSRGEMIGVRFNKDFDWVGGNICYCEE